MTVFLLSPLAFIAFLWWRLPMNLLDNMMMDSEFKITCVILCIGTIGHLGVAILFGTSHNVSLTNGLWGLCILFSTAAPSLMSTLWIPRRISRNRGIYGISPCRDLVLGRGLFKDRQNGSNGVRMTDISKEMRALIADERKMGALMAHMAREFSLESFLCFVELVQFKNHVISTIQEQSPSFDPMVTERRRYRFYGHCPKSSIVFNQKPQDMYLREVLEGSAAGIGSTATAPNRRSCSTKNRRICTYGRCWKGAPQVSVLRPLPQIVDRVQPKTAGYVLTGGAGRERRGGNEPHRAPEVR